MDPRGDGTGAVSCPELALAEIRIALPFDNCYIAVVILYQNILNRVNSKCTV
jgi:hypothetical protein